MLQIDGSIPEGYKPPSTHGDRHYAQEVDELELDLESVDQTVDDAVQELVSSARRLSQQYDRVSHADFIGRSAI